MSFNHIRVVYVSSNTLGKVLILYHTVQMMYMSSLLVRMRFEAQVSLGCVANESSLYICFLYQFLKHQTPHLENLKNPASQMTPKCHIEDTHSVESKTGKWHVPSKTSQNPDLKKILCFTVVEVQMGALLVVVMTFCD